MVDLSDQFFPGRKFIRENARSANKWDKDKNITPILLRGIVVDDYDVTGQTQDSFIKPAFSMKVKIIGESYSSNNPLIGHSVWASPFLPLHFLMLPEPGEEVLLIREFNSAESEVYWIGRVNETSYITRFLAREWQNESNPVIKYGFPFRVEDLVDEKSTPKELKIISKKLKRGDVALQGRTGSYHIHSFDNEQKRGTIEEGVDTYDIEQIETPAGPRNDFKEVPGTKVKHYGKKSIEEIENFSTGTEKDAEVGSIITTEADKIIHKSSASDSEEVLQNQILGNSLNEFLINLSSEMKEMNKSLKDVLSTFLEHTHSVDGENIIISVPIQTSTGPRTEQVGFSVSQKTTSSPPSSANAQQASVAIDSFSDRVDSVIETIDNHLSKNQFIN